MTAAGAAAGGSDARDADVAGDRASDATAAGRRFGLGPLLAVALVAALVRVGWEVDLARDDGPVPTLAHHLLGDERAYDAQARVFAAGADTRERAFYQEPLYAWLLGRLYAAWPPPPLDGAPAVVPQAPVHRAAIWIQHLLGVITAVLVALLGARCFGPAVAWLAGLFAALSGPLVFHESMVLKASLAVTVFTAALLLWHRLLQGRATARGGLVLGLVTGMAILLRGNAYLLLAFILASLLLRRAPRWSAAAAVIGGALLAIAPVTIHNLRRGDAVLTTYQAGTNLAIGQPDSDDPRAGVYYEPLRAGRGDARWEERDAIALAEAAAGRPLSSREISAHWRDVALAAVAHHPLAALERAGLKLAHLFHGVEPGDVKDWPFFRRRFPWLSSPLSDMRWIGPLALLAVVLLPWRTRCSWVLRGGLASVALTLVLFYVMARYRLTAAPCLWILAAAGVVAVARAMVGGPGVRRVAVGALTVALLLLGDDGRFPLMPDPYTGRTETEHTDWGNLATVELALAQQGDDARLHRDRAVDAARRALALAPLYPGARRTLILALDLRTDTLEPRPDAALFEALRLAVVLEGERTGRDVLDLLEADRDTLAATAWVMATEPSRPGGDAFVGPGLAFAYRRMAQPLRAPDEWPRALALIDRAMAFDPDEPEAHVQRAWLLRRMGRLDEAEADYRVALDAGVDSLELHNNYGNLLLDLGRPGQAVEQFARALELSPGHPLVLRNLQRARDAAATPRSPDPADR